MSVQHCVQSKLSVPRAALFIPCYNCEKQVLRVVQALYPSIAQSFESIFLIDNQSQDRTAEVISEFIRQQGLAEGGVGAPAKVVLIKHSQNYGLGGSFKTAVKLAREQGVDYIFWLHGDDQADVQDLDKMVKAVANHSPSAVFGCRFMSGSKLEGYSRVRELGNRGLNIIYSFFLKQKVYDIGSGLNAFRVADLPLNDIEHWPRHIAYDLFLLFHFFGGDYRVINWPITWRESDQVSNVKNINVGLLVLRELLRYLIWGNTIMRGESAANEERAYQTIDGHNADGG